MDRTLACGAGNRGSNPRGGMIPFCYTFGYTIYYKEHYTSKQKDLYTTYS